MRPRASLAGPWARRLPLPVTLVWGLLHPMLLPAQESARWRPGERVLLTSFHHVTAMARDERRVYAVTEGGLEILETFGPRWQPPSTVVDGYPAFERPQALAYDEMDRTLWVGTRRGSLYSYQVDFGRWTHEGSPGVGPVLALAVVRERAGEEIYLRTPGGWYRTSRFVLGAEPVPERALPERVRILELPAAERLALADPAFAAAGGTLTLDGALRRWPVTDFVADERQGVFWLGTAGDNLYRYDSRTLTAEPHRFGLLAPGVSALASDGDAIWFGGDGRGARRGVTLARGDLQDWEHHEAGVSATPGERVSDILPLEDAVWFATEGGLVRMERGSGAWSRVETPDPGVSVTRLAPAPQGGVWAATSRGLLEVGPSGEVSERGRAGPAALAVVAGGGEVWVAGQHGLARLGGEPARAPTEAGPAGAVVDLARADDGLWAATRDGLWRFDGVSWQGPTREPVLAAVGRVHRMRVDGSGLWVTGEGGAAVRPTGTQEWEYFVVGEDLPGGPVTDVLSLDGYVYLATPLGAVRFEWRGRP